MILCLGPIGTGKTTLLKLISADSYNTFSIGELPSVVPTVGTNIAHVTVAKNVAKPVHELGGAVAAIWRSYYADCTAILFVIDIGNIRQASCACIQLLEILTYPQLNKVPILIVLNKIDIKSGVSIIEMKKLLNLKSIEFYGQENRSISIQEISCFDRTNLDYIKTWLSNH